MRTGGYLSFTGEDASEGCVVRVLSLGVPSVPALDDDCCLVHLLDEPLSLLLGDLPPSRRDGAATLGQRRRSVIRGGGNRREILLGLCQGGALKRHIIVGCGLQDVAKRKT